MNSFLKAPLIALGFMIFFPFSCCASDEEISPLNIYMRTTWPPYVKTIEDAALYALAPTGYRLDIATEASASAESIVNDRIPLDARLNRTMPIIDALQLLIGPQRWVIVDPAHKLVTFQDGPP